jgi:EAL domain-containing protein (putative c-di-GMP-specific phosphodiesterase class I)
VLTKPEATFTLVGAPFLEYHPVVDLSSGRLLGMEALVRWQHPTEGRISPDRLIPEAMANGDIGPLSRWIVMEACEQACRWSPSIQLGVNCSSQQLRHGEASKAVSDALERSGFRAGQLTIEVTEDAVIDPDASADLRALSEMGVQLSVDDVGTNWASFEPFKRHSISTLKIDGSFIAGLMKDEGINRLVVETVIHMAHSLGMSAIVESVETATQVEIVRSFSADAAQGFFFARPMSSADAAEFAAGSEVPQFSLTRTTTLMKPHAGPTTLGLFEVEPAPHADAGHDDGGGAATDRDTAAGALPDGADASTSDVVEAGTGHEEADSAQAIGPDTDTSAADPGSADPAVEESDAVDAPDPEADPAPVSDPDLSAHSA